MGALGVFVAVMISLTALVVLAQLAFELHMNWWFTGPKSPFWRYMDDPAGYGYGADHHLRILWRHFLWWRR